MSEEQIEAENGRFVIICNSNNQIVGEEKAEAAAKSAAEYMAEKDNNSSYSVYQRIGIAKVEPKVSWKATR